jgi:hypothetical protein
LLPDGTWERVRPRPGEKPFDSQDWLLRAGGAWRLGE